MADRPAVLAGTGGPEERRRGEAAGSAWTSHWRRPAQEGGWRVERGGRREERGGWRRREEGREEEGRDAYYYVECKQWVQVGVGVGCR